MLPFTDASVADHLGMLDRTEIDLPLGWRRARLGDVLCRRTTIVHPRDNPTGSSTFVGLEHIEPGTGLRIGSEAIDLAALTGRRARFFRGDIVYGYLRPYLNKVWIAEFDGLCSVDQYVYTYDPAETDPRFVAAFMRSDVFLRQAPIEESPGQLPRIRSGEVDAVAIPLPPLEEQRRIADVLDAQMAGVRRARAAAEAQLEAVHQLPAAYLRAAFAPPADILTQRPSIRLSP